MRSPLTWAGAKNGGTLMAYLEEGGDGVSGWLGAFVVMIGIFTPLGILWRLWGMYSDPMTGWLPPSIWSNLQLLVWSISIVTVAICWYICWRLNHRQVWKTVPITIGLYWLVTAVNLAGNVLGVAFVLGVPVSAVTTSLGLLDYLPVATATAVTLYFLMSKRVKLTYPRHADDNEVREAFD